MLATGACGRARIPADELVLLNEQPIQRVDPRYTTGGWDVKVSRLLAPGLTSIENREARVVNDLAEEIAVEGDTAYRVRLRADARFADGKAVDAEDVRYTFESVRDPLLASPFRKAWDEILAGVDVLGPREIRFRLKKARAPFLTDLTFGIVDRRVAEPEDAAVRAAARAHLRPPPFDPAREPTGAGAFRIEARAADRLVLARNPYARAAPRVSRFVVRTIRDDNSRFLALLGRSGDLIQNGIPPLVVETFEKDPRLALQYGPSATLTYIGFNLAAPGTRDLRVRQAIAHALNRPLIVAAKLRGHAALASGMLPAANAYRAAGLPALDYDPAAARRLLDQAGYPDPDGDGPLPRLRLTWKTSSNRFRVALAHVFAAELAEVGIEVDVRPFEQATFVSDVTHGNFQLFSYQATDVVEPDMLRAFFHSTRIPTDGNGWSGLNRFRYRNADVDRWLDQGAEVRDPERRRALYADVQRALAAELPMLPLWFEDNVVAAGADVAGYTVTATATLGGAATAWKRGRR